MTMMDILVGAIIAGMVGAAAWYLFRNKKKEGTCTGCSCCPLAEGCGSRKE